MKAVIGALVAVSLALSVGVIWQQTRIGKLEAALSGDTPARDGTGAPGLSATDEDLGARVAMLEKRVVQLQRVAVARAGKPGDPDTVSEGDVADYENEIDQIKEDLNALVVGQALDTDAGRERLRKAVRQEQEAVMDERRREWQDRMRKEQDDMLKQFADEQHLSDEQYDQMTAAVSDTRGQMESLWEGVRKGDVGMRDARQQMRDLRDSNDQKIQQILDSDQYAAYVEMRDEQWGPRRRGGP